MSLIKRRPIPGMCVPFLILAVTVLAIIPVACTPATTGADTTLGVATTIPTVADFVKQVGDDLVEVTVMVPAGASPHTYEPIPSQMTAMTDADAYVKVGSGVEFEVTWLDKLIAQNPDITVVDCSAGIEIVNNDPHIWNSPVNAGTMIDSIVAGLSSADPENADVYASNGATYNAQLAELHDYVAERFAGATERHFLIYHPAFAYFAREYDLEQIAIEKEGKTTTPQTLQQSIALAQQYNLQYVFVAPQFATADAESVADAIGGETVFIDPLPGSYISNIRSVAAAIGLELE